jgi:hypothetical protein
MTKVGENMTNLDKECFEAGVQVGGYIGQADLQKALGVLECDGVFAYFSYLKKEERKEKRKKEVEALKEQSWNHLHKYDLTEEDSYPDNALPKLGENIDSLLLQKMLLERMLAYAIYHTKAKEK